MQKILNLFDFKQKVDYKLEILSGLTVALALVPEAIAFAQQALELSAQTPPDALIPKAQTA